MRHPFTPCRLWLLACFCLLALTNGPALAQSPAWQWVATHGNARAYGTAVDTAGNVYETGQFSDSTTFGTKTLIARASMDGYVAKLTRAGAYQWAVPMPTSSTTAPNALATDAQGNVYVIGSFFDQHATFGAITLTQPHYVPTQYHEQAFVGKLNPAGVWQWVTAIGGRAHAHIWGLAVDSRGRVAVTGDFLGDTATFGATRLITPARAGFVARLDATGAWQWAVGIGGTSEDGGRTVATDSTGAVYVAGIFQSPTLTVGATTVTCNGPGPDGFLAKLSPAGIGQWVVSAEGARGQGMDALAVTPGGDVFVAGSYIFTALFGTTALTSGPRYPNSLFVARLTTAGAWQWAENVGDSDFNSVRALTLDRRSRVYLTGEFRGSSAAFGSLTVDAPPFGGLLDIYVAALDPDGAWQWATCAGGSGLDWGRALAVDAAGAVYVAGGVVANDSLLATFGPVVLRQGGGYVARLDAAPLRAPADSPAPLFALYPNPARRAVRLTGGTGATATLFDALGRPVRTQALGAEGTATLDLTGLPAGLYVVRCGGTTRRLVVE